MKPWKHEDVRVRIYLLGRYRQHFASQLIFSHNSLTRHLLPQRVAAKVPVVVL
jgi:hypothetical protein